jgi:hypothetical protein
MATGYVVAICLLSVVILIQPFAAESLEQLNATETICRTELNTVSYSIGEPYALVLFGLKNSYFTDIIQLGCAPISVFLSRLVHACSIYHDLVEDFYCEFLRLLDETLAQNSDFNCATVGRRKRFGK